VYIVLDSMYVTMSISTGLYPKLDLWKVNKLHYITLHFGTLVFRLSLFTDGWAASVLAVYTIINICFMFVLIESTLFA